MTETPSTQPMPADAAGAGEVEEAPLEDGLVAGRPVEDRSFEVVEVGVGASLGVAIGAVVAGPLGAAAGGVVGAGVGLVAGEAIERLAGHAAETTDASEHAEPARPRAPEPPPPDPLRAELLQLLAGEGEHMPLDEAVDRFPPEAMNRRAPNVTFTPWQLLEHIRLAQRDVLAHIRDRTYVQPRWPDDYWPAPGATATPEAWAATIEAIRADRRALHDLVADPATDLLAPIRGTPGHTLVREVRTVGDHTAYHVGELGILRQVMGAWPADRTG
jgi:hypothetical protein